MTLLCEPDELLAAQLTAALRGEVQTVATLPDLALAMVRHPSERVVVIGTDVELSSALSFSDHLRDERPDARVILLRDGVDPGVAAEATNAGVQEVVPSGYPDLLADAFARAQDGEPQPAPLDTREAEPRQPLGRVVTVFSAKGGCGKTTMATNLAVALHAGGARTVCLVDLDLAFGDVAISMQLTPRRTIVDAVEAGGAMALHVDDLVTAYRPGLDCVLAPVEPGDSERIPAALVSELLRALQQRYDYVVVDTPSQFSEHVLAAMDLSHHQVLLTTPEIPALKNLRLTLDTLDLLSYAHEARSIVLNRADERGGLSTADVERAVHNPITARVPASQDVPASINRGVPIVAESPEHPVSKAITDFAVRAVAGETVTEVGASSRRGLRLRKRSG